MHFFTGLFLIFLAHPSAQGTTQFGGCAVHLGKEQLQNLQTPLAEPIESLASHWPFIDLMLEWRTHENRNEPNQLQLGNDGRLRLPNLTPERLRGGRLAVTSEAFDQRGRRHTNAGLFHAEAGKLVLDEELDGDKDLTQFFLMIYAALAAVESVDNFELNVIVQRCNILDMPGAGLTRQQLRDFGDMERTYAPNVHRLNAQARVVFDRILKLKNEGLDDWEVLHALDHPLLKNLPLGFGPWQLAKLRIAVQAERRVALFENDDSVTIKYLFKRR